MRGPLQGGEARGALVTLATLVGTVMLARAVDDADLSDEVLQATRAAFKLAGQAEAG